MNRILTTCAALLAAAFSFSPAFAVAPHPRLPQGTILLEGQSATVKGQLAVHRVDGRAQAYLESFATPVFERQNLYYTQGGPSVGILPRRPPFRFQPITSMALESENGTDLVALTQLLGEGTEVELTGVWGDFGDGRILGVGRGLMASSVSLRGHILSEEVLSIQRWIAIARREVRQLLESQRRLATIEKVSARHLGGLLFLVTANVRVGHAGDEVVEVYNFNGASRVISQGVLAHTLPAGR